MHLQKKRGIQWIGGLLLLWGVAASASAEGTIHKQGQGYELFQKQAEQLSRDAGISYTITDLAKKEPFQESSHPYFFTRARAVVSVQLSEGKNTNTCSGVLFNNGLMLTGSACSKETGQSFRLLLEGGEVRDSKTEPLFHFEADALAVVQDQILQLSLVWLFDGKGWQGDQGKPLTVGDLYWYGLSKDVLPYRDMVEDELAVHMAIAMRQLRQQRSGTTVAFQKRYAFDHPERQETDVISSEEKRYLRQSSLPGDLVESPGAPIFEYLTMRLTGIVTGEIARQSWGLRNSFVGYVPLSLFNRMYDLQGLIDIFDRYVAPQRQALKQGKIAFSPDRKLKSLLQAHFAPFKEAQEEKGYLPQPENILSLSRQEVLKNW